MRRAHLVGGRHVDLGSVRSYWQRLDVNNREGNHNLAVSGAQVAGLVSQVRSAVRVRARQDTNLRHHPGRQRQRGERLGSPGPE